MNQRARLISRIKDLLAIYATRVDMDKGEASAAAESFYCELLNLLLGYRLKNMNLVKPNFPAIDLGDDSPEVRLGVQVTSTTTRKKVQDTLDTFFRHDLEQIYTRLVMLIVGKWTESKAAFRLNGTLDFDPDRDIWDRDRLVRMIEGVETLEHLERIAVFLEQNLDICPREREPLMERRMESAMDAKYFVGREEKLEEIAERFRSTRVVFLSGLGGMGKTELALRYGTDCHIPGWRFVYFVRFKKSFEQTLAENIAPFIPGFRREGLSEQQILEGAMQILHRADPNDLLILDNADEAEESIDGLRRKLSSIPMRVLVTTRAESSSAVIVDRMDKEHLRTIFRNHGAGIPEPEMDELIDAVDGHTLTVDLMARLLHRKQEPNTYRTLRDALLSRDLENADLRTVTSAYYGDEGQARINEHLKVVFQVAKLGPAEQTLLRFACLLPRDGLDAEIFAGAAVQNVGGFFGLFRRNRKEMKRLDTSTKVKDVLQPLADGGWLEWEQGILKLHPVICIVCREELKPTREKCHAFVKGVWGWYDEKKYDHVRFTQIAELLTNASEILGDPDGWYIGTAGYLWSKLGESQQALQCLLRDVELTEQSQPDSNNLATSYNNVGVTYDDLGDHAKALEYKLKALAIREKVLSPEHPDLAGSYNNVGITYGDLGDHAKALEYHQKALAIREKVLPPEHPSLAGSYNNVGSTYGDLGDHVKALEYKQKALEIQEKTLPENHPYNAMCCNNIAWTYYKMGNCDTALKLMRRAADIAEQSLPEGHPDRVNYRRWAERFEREIAERRTTD